MTDSRPRTTFERHRKRATPNRKHLDWEALEPVLTAIRAMADLYDNSEASRERAALTAARESRPAYWSSARYHNQAALLVAQYANTDGLASAIRQWADDAYPSGARHTSFLLSTLIPLNPAAASELHEAIASHHNQAVA